MPGESPSGEGLAAGRSRREPKKDPKQDRFEAIRAARASGQKIKYEVQDVKPVYEFVDEEEYAKMVSERQMDQFVDVVEGTSEEYYDDGREIFDDEMDDASQAKLKKAQREGKSGGKEGVKGGNKGADVKGKSAVRSGDIRNMFANAHTTDKKKAIESVALSKDKETVLEDLLDELNGDLEEPEEPSRDLILFGSSKKTVSEILSSQKNDDFFAKKSIFRKKIKTNPLGHAHLTEWEEPSGSQRKRHLPDSPIKSESKTPLRQKPIFMAGSGAPSSSTKRHKGTPLVLPQTRLGWAEDSNDTSNTSYEIDTTSQNAFNTFNTFNAFTESSELDDGWMPEPEEETLISQPTKTETETERKTVVVETPSLRAAVRPLPKIEKKWTMSEPRPQPRPQTVMEPEVEAQLTEMRLESSTGIRIYWLDACEDLALKGCVNLFGKMVDGNGVLVSVCVRVTGIERLLFFLMKTKMTDPDNEGKEKDVTCADVQNEFRERIMNTYKINSFRSVQKTKKYAFEKTDVPDSAEYLQVRYPFCDPMLPEELKGETFSEVLGRNTSPLELFLLERKLKGPCWLDIEGARPLSPRGGVSWCREEFLVNCGNVHVCKKEIRPPSVVVLALSFKIVVDQKTKQNEIVAVAGVLHGKFPLNTAAPKPIYDSHFIVVSETVQPNNERKFGMNLKKDIENSKMYSVKAVSGEKLLLEGLLQKIEECDADVLVFHDAVGRHLDILLQRLSLLVKGQTWSRLGRLKRSEVPKGRMAGAQAATGRLICDIKHSASELIHTKSYSLTDLIPLLLKDPAPHHAHHAHHDLESDQIQKMFSSRDLLERLIDHTLMDALFILRIMAELNVLPLALQITNIAGNIMSRTLLGGRSERNEYLLLHAFTAKDYICPDKQMKNFQKKEEKNTKMKNKNGKINQSNQGNQMRVKKEEGEEEEEGVSALADEEREATGEEVGGETPHAPGGKRKPAYAGGLVLEPKKGLYDTYILLMDFNSLYPSIIQEFNICFTTVDRKWAWQTKDTPTQEDVLLDMPPRGGSNEKRGVLPTEIKILVERRQEVKKLIKQTNPNDVEKLVELDIRQKALKLTANSMYGCLGFTMSRFFARPLAALITTKGREILMNTKELIEKLNLEVIYGDTDSVMINTHLLDWDAVMEIGSKVRFQVDKQYKSLKLEIDGVFRSLLLLQKKKYAALVASKKEGKMHFTRELKGLDIVRRDWSQLAADTGRFVIDQILSDPTSNEPRDDVQGNIIAGLKSVGEYMKLPPTPPTPPMPPGPPTPSGLPGHAQTLFELFGKKGYFQCREELELYVITKQLNKDANLYGDAKSLPHVQVALRWNEKNATFRKFRAGDTIPYVICNEVPPGVSSAVLAVAGKKIPHTQRAFHIDEVRGSGGALTVDKQYYLAEQIHKVVTRLCEPIVGVDTIVIAECLGVDKSLYGSYFIDHAPPLRGEEETDAELFRDCLPLTVVCPNCRNNWTFDEPIWEQDGGHFFSLQKCPFCDAIPSHYLIKIRNCLRIQIGEILKRYYKPRFMCQDVSCHYQCSFVPPKFHRGQPVCPLCEEAVLKAEFSDHALYRQLCCWRNAFDPQRALVKMRSKSWHGSLAGMLKQDVQLAACYESLANYVQTFLDQSAYGRVNFSDFFPRPQTELNKN